MSEARSNEPQQVDDFCADSIDSRAFFYLVESSLQECFGLTPYSLRALREEASGENPLVVNVTLRNSLGLRASMSGESSSFEKAIRIAVARAVEDDRFSYALIDVELPTLAIELWLRLGSEAFDPEHQQLALGLEGLEISSGSRSAYYKPSVAITSSCGTTAELISKICLKANISADEIASGVAQFRRTHWVHFAKVGGMNPVRMEGLRIAAVSDITPDSVTTALEAAATHLMNIQMAGGSFLYQLDLITNCALEHDEKHVRTAGCVYSLAAFADRYQGTPLGSRAERICKRAIEYLLRHIRPLPSGVGSYVTYRSSPEGALGATALLMRALHFAPFKGSYQAVREKLRDTLWMMYREDGSFQTRVIETSASPDSQDYYPGEALLALAVEEQFHPQLRPVKAAFGAALQYFRTSFTQYPKTSYVLWHTECWARVASLAKQQGDDVFAAECTAFVKELADHVIALQLLDTQQPRTMGGFARYGKPTAASLAYAEGILHACRLMQSTGEHEEGIRYLHAAGQALKFCFRLQIQQEQVAFFRSPSSITVGSVTTDLESFSVRADNAQHFITLGLRYLETFSAYQ
jgi:hypothetical protein